MKSAKLEDSLQMNVSCIEKCLIKEMQKNCRETWRGSQLALTNTRTTIRFGYNCLNCTNLEWVDSFRYLGVLIDTKLKWNNYFQTIATKATRILIS